MELLRIFGNQFINDFIINFGVGILLCFVFFLVVVYTVVKVIMVQESNHTTNSNQSLNEDEPKKDNKE